MNGKHGMSRGMRCLALVMCLALGLTLTGCGQSLDGHISAAWEAVGRPAGLQKIYHDQYQGKQELEDRAGGSLEEAFRLSEDRVPDSGHLFILKTGSNSYYVLENDQGEVLGTADGNYVSRTSQSLNTANQQLIKSVNDQYAAGKMSDQVLAQKKLEINQQLDEAMAFAEQGLVIAGYSLCAVMCPVSESSQPNAWHQLTDKQMNRLK